MVHQPGSRSLRCDHCGDQRPLGPPRFSSQLFDLENFSDNPSDEAALVANAILQCPNCGAEVEFSSVSQSEACAFCTNPLVATPQREPKVSVHALLPMDISFQTANERMKRWKKSVWFAPGDFARAARHEGILQNIYLPFWIFNAETDTQYHGERGIQKDQGTKNGTETRWTRVSGEVSVNFVDLPVPASRYLSDRLKSQLVGWDFDQLEAYDPHFLLGAAAEISATSVKDAYADATTAMKTVITQHIKADIGGDRQRIRSSQTQHNNVRCRHVLVPVWLGAYRYGGKVFQIAVNGRTGQIAAERPWSWWKIGLSCAGLTLIALAIAATVSAVK